MDYKSLRATQVILDPENPRLPDGTSSDKEAINRLLIDGFEQLVALARDLVEQGESNPTELPIVLKQGKKYLALEGNRRFAALKLLGDPKLADEPAHQVAFARLTTRGKAPETVYCVVTESRQEADRWITLRHTGANGGVGVRGWSANQAARHRRRMNVTVDSGTLRAIVIADELTEAYQADEGLVRSINRVRAEKLTNIGRFFANGVLTRMQFEIRQATSSDGRTLWTKHSAEQLHRFFKWVFTFLEQEPVDSFKNDEIRGNLLNKHGDFLPSPSEALGEIRRLADYPYSPRSEPGNESHNQDANRRTPTDSSPSGNANVVPSAQTKTGGPGNSTPGTINFPAEQNTSGNVHSTNQNVTNPDSRRRDQKPERFLYSTVRLPNIQPNIQRLLKEAKQLPIEDNYAMACVLARVIIELVVSDPKVLAWSGTTEGASLDQKIEACIMKLDPEIEKPRKRTRHDLVQAYLEINTVGVHYMHQFIHNANVKADPHLARRFSAAYSPLLNAVNEVIK